MPEDGETTLFGKKVSALQSDVNFVGDQINGTLKYVTGYTGFSGNPDYQEGNFLAFKVAPSLGEGATYTIEVVNGHSGPVQLDSDMNAVIRIESNSTQSLKIVGTKGDDSVTRIYSFAGLTLEAES